MEDMKVSVRGDDHVMSGTPFSECLYKQLSQECPLDRSGARARVCAALFWWCELSHLN